MQRKRRDYRLEYDNYQGTVEQKINRAKRNAARREMMKEGKVHKGDGMDVDHKSGNPRNNRKSNLRAVPKSKNRSFSRKSKNRANHY